jgi:predicted dehydrogenase
VTCSVRLAILGLGLIGLRHAKAIIALPDVELAGVVEPSGKGRAEAAKLGIACFDTLSELIEKGAPDGIIIATPTPLHAEQAMECVRSGIPILIEKPLATSAMDARALIKVADTQRVPVLVGHHRRYNPLIERAREVIQSGKIGGVRAVQATCWFYKPDAYFDEAPWRKQQGAGPISVNLVHDVDLIRHLVGEVTTVRDVAAPSRRGFANEDVAAAVLEFANGAVGTITVSDSIAAPWSWEMTSREHPIYPPTPESCYLIGGSKASLSIPDLRVWSHDGGEPDWWSPISATHLKCAAADPLVNQINHFASVVRDGAAPFVSGYEGLRTLQVVEAIQTAAATGQTIRLDGAEQQKPAGSPTT